jgi:hypothetical protein
LMRINFPSTIFRHCVITFAMSMRGVRGL